MATQSIQWDLARQRAAGWLLQGISPQRLAITLSLGFVVGCLPVVGIPTALCAIIATAFRLNQPAIQAANYLAMPFQLALIVPFMRLGGKFAPSTVTGLDLQAFIHSPMQMLTHSSAQLVMQVGVLTGQALLGWFLLAIPVVLLMSVTLTGVLRRVPAVERARR